MTHRQDLAESKYDQEGKDHRWWLDDDCSAKLWDTFQHIYSMDENRRALIKHHMRLYGSKMIGNLSDQVFDVISGSRMKYNAIQSVCETAVSRLGKNRPAAAYVTKGGTLADMRAAKALGLYTAGVFENADVYQRGRESFRTATVVGSGVLAFFPKETEAGWSVGCERVFPWEIVIDEHDGRMGEPRSYYRVHYIDREVAFEKFSRIKKWKSKEKKLREALTECSVGDREAIGRDTTADTIEIIEAWHLPSGKGAKDGRHVFAGSSVELQSDPWNHQWVPLAFYHWQPAIVGYWGSGIAETINGIQVTINRMLKVAEASYALVGRPWILSPASAKMRPEMFTNKTTPIIEYIGDVPPTVVTHAPLNQDFHNQLDRLKQEANDLAGVSQLSSSGKKPADLESGEALRRFNEIEDARHADPGINYERFYMNCAKIILKLSHSMAKEGKSPTAQAHVKRRNRGWMEDISWDRVKLDENDYMIQVYPTSILPSQPAGRVATIQEWFRVGFISKGEAFWLLEIPDLDSHLSPDAIMVEAILDDVEAMLDEEEPEPRLPEPYQDLQLSRKLMTAAYLKARMLKAEEDRLELMRRYIAKISEYEEAANAMGQQQQPMADPMGQQQQIAKPPESTSLAALQGA